MNHKNQALVRVHLGYFCMSLTAALVALSSWHAFALVCSRMWIGAAFLAILLWQKNISWQIHGYKAKLHMLGTGLLLVCHWITFFASIRVSGIPIAVVSVSSIPVFSAILEPLLHRERPQYIDVCFALFVLVGIFILIENVSLHSAALNGVLLGLISACTKALRDITSKSLVRKHGSVLVMFYHLLIGGIVLLPWLHPTAQVWDSRNILIVLALGTLGTGIAHTLTLSGLHVLKASTVNLLGTLTSIYQILFGIILVHQIPSLRTLIGGSIVISIAILETRRHAKAT